jgi:hypothetical protein
MATETCDGVEFRRMTVTPEMAREWLSKNSHNRPINRHRVLLLKEQIDNDTFALTHQGIAFYGDFEELADGQHRLAAIADGEKGVEMMVTWGLSRDAVHAIDRGRPRSITNVLNFMGMSLGQSHTAACRALWLDYHAARKETVWNNQVFDTHKFLVFCNHVLDAVNFAMPPKACRGLSHASVTAAIAAAWFTQSHVDIARFKELLHYGTGASDSETSAIKLREYLLTHRVTSGGNEARQELYLRASTALRAFFEGRGLSKLYCRPDARFPIPDCKGLE